MALSAPATKVPRSAKAFTIGTMQDWSPFSAASAAYWAMEVGLEVECDCMFSMASMSSAGPPQ